MKSFNAIVHDQQSAALVAASLTLFSFGFFVILLWGDHTSLLSLSYLAAALLIGGWLYVTASPLYLGFVVWLWFLTPFLRRVIDFYSGTYTPPGRSLVLLTPFAVTILSVFDIPRFGGRLIHRRYLPYFLCLIGVSYGYLVGLVKVGFTPATSTILGWLSPIVIGFYVLNRERSAIQHRRIIKTTMMWGVLILGAYGIYQFYAPPAWDAFWMINSDMSSIGKPRPHQVRIFSMLDSPGPFAVVMMTGLVLILISKGIFPLVAAVPGYLSFLLAGVRGAWIGWVLAVGTIIFRLEGRAKRRLIKIAIVATVVTIPAIMTGPIAERAGNRMQTLENVQDDGSLQARMRLYQNVPVRIAMNPIGWGLGSRNMDSGVLTLFWQLGWFGATLYLSGVALLFRQVWMGSSVFHHVVAGIAAAYIIQLFAGSQLVGQSSGVMFWSLTSLAVALQVKDPDKKKVY